MSDLAIPLSGVDALHAHFAAWLRYLEAKEADLAAQLAKLEARKNRPAAAAPEADPPEAGYLALAFGAPGDPPVPDGLAAAQARAPDLPAAAAETPPAEADEAAQPAPAAAGTGQLMDAEGNWVNP